MRAARALLLLGTAGLLYGCVTVSPGDGWAEEASLTPGWQRLRSSAHAALTEPSVWVPAAAALMTQVDGIDQKISSWARRETPVFGSQARATSASDELRTAAVAADALSVLLTPSSETGSAWLIDKAKGYAVDLAAATTAIETTSVLKRVTRRTRPNDSGDDSFPSGHATTAAVYTRLASLNLDAMALQSAPRASLEIALAGISIGTDWARIEGGWHYPSDTLVGMAIGNFCARFFNDAFLGLHSDRTQIAFVPVAGGAQLMWHWRFTP